MRWLISDSEGEVIALSSGLEQVLKVGGSLLSHCRRCQDAPNDNLENRILTIDGNLYTAHVYSDNNVQRVFWKESFEDSSEETLNKIRKNFDFFDTIFDHTGFDMAIFNPDHTYIYVNSRGIKDPELRRWIIGKDDFDYCKLRNLNDDLAKERRQLFNKAVEAKQNISYVDHIVQEDGSEKFMRRVFSPVVLDGQVLFVVGVGYDNTEITLLNRELQTINMNYASMFEQTVAGIFTSRTDGRIEMANDAFAKMFGYTREEVLNLNAKDLYFSTEQRSAFLGKLSDAVEFNNYPEKLKHKDGSPLHVISNIAIIPDENGEEIIRGVMVDVTKEREAIDTIKWLSSIPKEDPNPIFRLDAKTGEILYMNEACETTFEDVDVEGMIQGFFEESMNYHGDKSEHTAQIGKKYFTIRCAKIKHDKPYVNFYFSDVTERQIAFEEEIRLNKTLDKRNNDLRQFSFMVSHNLRAPISNLIGLSHLLKAKKPDLPADIEEILARILESTLRIDQVFHDVSLLLNIQTSAFSPATYSLNEAVNDVLRLLAEDEKKNNVQIAAKVDDAEASGILSFFKSIVYNLLSNSIKYRSDKNKPEISIRCLKEGNLTTIEVQDNGLGFVIDNNTFTPFVRQHKHIEGKGLGLTMVKTQVDQLDGSLEIESQPGVGTKVKIVLPDS